MADSSNSTGAPGANTPDIEIHTAAAFDPADWLTRFREVGGWWVICADNKVSVGWKLDGFSEGQNAQARAIFGEVENSPDLRAAIRDHLIASVGEVNRG